ncbi:hypothetical protein [Caballeronia sp. SL2Y3]|uniref:hypothetical protein n=1 Tax=Caballeronia sp. SL2Y3 TaxID=2878151 RepID=UPI001FD2BA90|nr:hypothetical protein [Caballeronia sp. SL2Y3]
MLPPHDAFRERVSRKDGSIGRQKTIESDAVTDLAALRRLIHGMFSAGLILFMWFTARGLRVLVLLRTLMNEPGANTKDKSD